MQAERKTIKFYLILFSRSAAYLIQRLQAKRKTIKFYLILFSQSAAYLIYLKKHMRRSP